MKRLISLTAALIIIICSLCVPAMTVSAASSFEDSLNDFNSVSEKTGDWDNFPNHPQFGLSVVGRKTTDSENSLIYSFSGKAVTSVSVRFVEYHGFVSAADYEISVYAGGAWQTVSSVASAESDISG